MTRFAQFVPGRIFGIVVFFYAGDCFCIEVAATIQPPLCFFTIVGEPLGFPLAPAKSQGPAKSLRLLGANVTLRPGRSSAQLPVRRRSYLINDINQVIRFDQLNPAQSAKLRGRLGFAQSLLFARVGRAMIHPVTSRQYSRTVGRKHPLTPELHEALEWWISALNTQFRAPSPLPPRSLSSSIRMPAALVTSRVLLSTKAAAAMLIRIYRGCFWSVRVFLKWSWPLLSSAFASHWPVVICCDNRGAGGAVVRGSFATPLGRALSSAWRSFASLRCLSIWIEFPPSELNCADPPSRIFH